ncbi:hypothetical protein VNI00_016463, partial [Paramarasmius palmivorus]
RGLEPRTAVLEAWQTAIVIVEDVQTDNRIVFQPPPIYDLPPTTAMSGDCVFVAPMFNLLLVSSVGR